MSSALFKEMSDLLSRHNINSEPASAMPPATPRKKAVKKASEPVPINPNGTHISQYYAQPQHYHESPLNPALKNNHAPPSGYGMAPISEVKPKRQMSQKQLDALKAGREARLLKKQQSV